MSRTTLILLVVLAVAVIGGGVFFWLNQDKVTGLLNSNTANTNTQVVSNTNTEPIRSTAPSLIEGDQKLGGTIKVNDVTVTLTGVTKAKTFESIEADKGKLFVVIYFMPVKPNEVLAVKRGLETGSRLTSGTTVYDLLGLKVASDLVTNDRGYLKFAVADTAKSLQLEVGSGANVQTVKLP